MKTYTIPKRGDWAAAIVSAVSRAKSGDRIVVNDDTQLGFAEERLKKYRKKLILVKPDMTLTIVDPNQDDAAERMLAALQRPRGGQSGN